MTRFARPKLPKPLLFLLFLGVVSAQGAWAGLMPTFEKAFLPSTVGPGSVATLRFTITNPEASPVTDLAFMDNLPAGVTLANPAAVATTCSGAAVTAPDGGGTVTVSGGAVGAASTCTVSVNVTSTTVGTHSNLTGDLTSSAGNSGPAAADLTVATDRPGFRKAFSPSAVSLGGRSTLTFTLDNSTNASPVLSLSFTDTFPTGLKISSPANAATTCTSGVVSASPGASLVTFTGGLLLAGTSCTVSVDVTAIGAGLQVNTSGELSSSVGGPLRSSGRATAALQVQVGAVAVTKDFLADPVQPGGTVELEFTITNRDRNFDATAVAFTDDLDATLAGLVATGLPVSNVCGPGSLLSGTGLLTLTGGSLAADGGTCSFRVTLQVPAGALTGAYPNTTSPVTATLGGSPFVGLPATETLFINQAPSLTKTFLINPVGSGGTTTVEFTLTNSSAVSAATAITFRDNLDAFLSGVLATALPAAGFCGAGSVVSITSIAGERFLVVSNASLGAGGTCTFTVDLQIPPGTAGGSYLNTADALSALVEGTTQEGAPASDSLVVAGAPSLRKEFTDDPVAPGSPVTLAFTLSHSEDAASPATGITFTDDLTATLAGLTALALPAADVCGVGSVLSGPTNLTLTGGQLAPGETCTFSVTLQVPAGALAGTYPNSTSSVMATVNGVTVTSDGGFDTLRVAGFAFSKAFIDDPVIAGGTVTLEFTLDNTGTGDATAISFSDNLNAALAGLAAVGLPQSNVCGVGSQIAGTTSLTFTGGQLLAGTSCTFSVTLQVPIAAADGGYVNTTSNLTATLGGSGVVLPPASDLLTVASSLLLLTKEFTDDPVVPGGMVTLEFTVTNLDAGQAVSALSFSDDLDAALSGLVALGLPQSDVCGVGSSWSGTSLLTLSGGSLPAGGSCTLSATLLVPAGAAGSTSATNTTSIVTGTIGGLPVSGSAASDDLRIDFVTFSKSFDGPTLPGGNPVLTFFIENLSGSTTISDLSFLDDLDAVLPGLTAVGLPQADACGVGSALNGTAVLGLTGGTLLPGGSCSIQVTLQVPPGAAAGTYPNTTSLLFESGLPVAGAAHADLQVLDLPPTFAKSFAPSAVIVGGGSTLTFTINNSASGVPATGLDFTDNLPAGVVVANPGNAATSCVGGTITALPGTALVGYSGGTVSAGTSCQLQVDVATTSPGELLNTTGDLTSSSGNSGTASALLRVIETIAFTKAFLTAPVLPGGFVQLEYTLTNPSATATVIDMTFTDDLDAVIPGLAAIGLPTTEVCGAGSQVVGSSVIAFSGGTLLPNTTCTFAVTVQVPAGSGLGTFSSSSSPLAFELQAPVRGLPLVAGPATADLEVAFLDFAKVFEAGPFRPGDAFLLTFTITNPDPANVAAGLHFTDDLGAVIPGLAAFGLPAADVCGTGSQVDGTTFLTFTAGTLAPGASCSFDVTLQMPDGAGTGTFTNVTSALTAVVNGAAVDGGAGSAATADIEALAPVLVIPTLGQWGLLVLVSLLAAAAVRRLGGR